MERLIVLKDFDNNREVFFQNVSTEIPVYHAVIYKSTEIAYVCTELEPNMVFPHIYVLPEYREPEALGYITDVFHKEYVSTIKEHGYNTIVVSCDIGDTGTNNFLTKLGFNMKPTSIGMYKIP